MTAAVMALAFLVGAELVPAQAAPAAPDRADAFLTALQDAVGRRDKSAVSRMIQYPAEVHVTGMTVPLQGNLTFLKLYDTIFTAELEQILAATKITRTPDGLTVGSAIWAKRAGDTYRISRFVVPAASVNSGLQHPPIRVVFYAGNPAAQFAGLLMKRDEVQPYVVRAARGRLLEAKIDRFRANDVAVRVVDASGKPLEARSRAGARTWSGVVPADGEYRVEIVRAAANDQPTLSYELAITVSEIMP